MPLLVLGWVRPNRSHWLWLDNCQCGRVPRPSVFCGTSPLCRSLLSLGAASAAPRLGIPAYLLRFQTLIVSLPCLKRHIEMKFRRFEYLNASLTFLLTAVSLQSPVFLMAISVLSVLNTIGMDPSHLLEIFDG